VYYMSKITEFILDEILDADGDLEAYAGIVKDNKDRYRTFEEYISSRIDVQELAKRLGLTTPRAIKSWAAEGIKIDRAKQCAIALKLNLEEANEFLSKYAGMRCLYPASQEDFRFMYVLIYREQLERRFPYAEQESVPEWMDRVFRSLGFDETEKPAGKAAIKKTFSTETETRVATKTYLDVLLEQNLEMLPGLKFRSAGEKALAYLDERVKDTPFEKNYGNRSSGNEEVDSKNERKGSIRIDLFEEEEKDHYLSLRDKLKEGEIPHRDVLIQFALGMTLNLKRKEVDQLLIKSGYEPLRARNLYEGLLLTLYLYEERMDLDDEEEGLEYSDFQVFVSEKVDEAMQYLPEAENLLKEIPQWYLNEQKRKLRLEKRCFSDMICLMSEKMTKTWKMVNQKKLIKISEATLRKSALRQIRELKNIYLDRDTYKTVLEIIYRTEEKWVEIVNSGALYKMERDDYLPLFKEILKELDCYYRVHYAPKKMRSEKKGQKGGKTKR